MGTTMEEIRAWFDRGKAQGVTHMIVVCDTFDHEDYPVYVKPGGDPNKVLSEYSGKDMQRVMEVYNLHLDRDLQLHERRSWHLEPAPPPVVAKERNKNGLTFEEWCKEAQGDEDLQKSVNQASLQAAWRDGDPTALWRCSRKKDLTGDSEAQLYLMRKEMAAGLSCLWGSVTMRRLRVARGMGLEDVQAAVFFWYMAGEGVTRRWLEGRVREMGGPPVQFPLLENGLRRVLTALGDNL